MQYKGLNTSQPYISKVLVENLPDGKIKTIVRVAMSADAMLGESVNSMKTTIVKVCDPVIIKKLSRNTKVTNIELIENARKEGKFGNLDLSIAEVKHVPRNKKETLQGYYITNVEFVFDNIIDLTFYVVCQHDMDHPKFARVSSSRHLKGKIYNEASVFAEDVFRTGRLVNKSKAFVYDDEREIQEKQKDYSISRGSKRIWTGPVNRYSANKPRSDGYVGYVAHGLRTEEPKLRLVEFPNTTIHDYRILEKISKIPFNCKIKESRPTLIRPKSAYFSNLCITNDSEGLVKMFFAIDIGEIVKDNIKIPRFVSADAGTRIALDPSKSSYEDVINLSLIKNMTIRRQSVDKFGNILFGGDEKHSEKIVESAQKGLKLSNAENRTRHLRNDDVDNVQIKRKGAIREIDNLYFGSDNKNIRFFTVTDNSMIDKKSGNYRYSVELDIEDGSIIYLQELYKSLKKGLNAMHNYHKSFVKGGKLDRSYFINEQGPWVWALDVLIRTIRAFKEPSNEDLEEKLYILAAPRTCTLESLGKLIETYEKVSQQIKNMMDELPTKSKRDAENMKANTVISGTRKFPLVINLQYAFKDVYEPNGGRDLGYDYLPTLQQTAENNPGLLTIKSEDFVNRTTQETLRYFVPGEAGRFTASQLSFLTPVSIRIKDNLFSTYNSNGVNIPVNNTELANFNALVSLYNFKKYGTIHSGGKNPARETRQDKTSGCLEDNLYAKQLNSFSHHVKNNLSNTMSSINVVAAKKYDSPCFEKTKEQEKDYAKLMMPNTTSTKYKEEVPSRGEEATHSQEEVGEVANLSSIFAPLFYMKQLDIYKELCCLVEKMNMMATVEGLPNQLQALLLNNRDNTTHQWYDAAGKSSLKTLKHAAFHYLNNKNLVSIEVMTEFAAGQIKSPVWVPLKETYINEAAANKKTHLLCRMRLYSNENICFSRNDFLDLNIFNQCFMLDVSGVSVPNTRRKVNRKVQPLTKMTSLDKNDYLKLESALMKTNLLFGQVVKQNRNAKKTRTTRQSRQTEGTASDQAATLNPRGGTSGGGTTGGGMY